MPFWAEAVHDGNGGFVEWLVPDGAPELEAPSGVILNKIWTEGDVKDAANRHIKAPIPASGLYHLFQAFADFSQTP